MHGGLGSLCQQVRNRRLALWPILLARNVCSVQQ
jgi:hypothetical protein